MVSGTASANGTLMEVPVEALLAPSEGYDDNDNVQVVLHGLLPNVCYTLGKYEVIPAHSGDDGGKMRIKQYAIRNTESICAEGAMLPPHLNMAVPFVTEISLGQLPAGNYHFEYLRADSGTGLRALNISSAPVPTVDSLPYAAVTNLISQDVIGAGEELSVTLTGVLNSTCTELDPEVSYRKLEDVYIILPTIRVKPGVLCAQILIPFEVPLKLGRPEVGHYLVHARSMNGKSVNRVIEVTR